MSEITEQFEREYSAFLEGAEGHKHFIIQQGNLYCVRKSCEGCSLQSSCESEEAQALISPLPNARRGIGFEERPFLVLKIKPEYTPQSIPQEVWQGNMSEALDEANLHFLIHDFVKKDLLVFKGQIRLYNHTKEQFEQSPLSQYFDYYQEYKPDSSYVSLDFSAVEPRLACATSRAQAWINVFKGKPQTIFKEVQFKDLKVEG